MEVRHAYTTVLRTDYYTTLERVVEPEPVAAMIPVTNLSLVTRAREHGSRTALLAPEGSYSYEDLLNASARVAATLLDGARDLREHRVAFLIPPGLDYVAVQWGIWRAGGIAVPLAISHPPAELEYAIRDSDATVVVTHPRYKPVVGPIAHRLRKRLLTTTQAHARQPGCLPVVEESRRAQIVYTSGTTGRPKGVVMTHANIRAQVTSLVEAWGWSAQDRTVLVLPLHHLHGIINVLTCALWSGATCEILPRFDADETWHSIERSGLTVFMAVPTIYTRLIAAWEAAPAERQRAISEACRRMRLMVSGSAALPVRTLERWREISGHTLLERYGMTELGMVLSNPLHGERRPGYVGTPLPTVQLRIVDEMGEPVREGTPGEVEVRGPNVFKEYWFRPSITKEAFRDGWFRTGDVAVVEDGAYRMLGRTSTDIIKTGGYKVSALEIEEALRAHPAVADCAVVGVEDLDWGEMVCLAIEVRGGRDFSPDEFRAWARERLAPYKIPREIRAVHSLPRNAMGKVTKSEVARLFARRAALKAADVQSTAE